MLVPAKYPVLPSMVNRVPLAPGMDSAADTGANAGDDAGSGAAARTGAGAGAESDSQDVDSNCGAASARPARHASDVMRIVMTGA